MKNSSLNLYFNYLAVDAILDEPRFKKHAQGELVSGLIDGIKNYVGNYIDPNASTEKKTISVLNLLAPDMIRRLFSFLGFKKIGILMELCMYFFHVDISDILEKIYNEIKSLISSGKLLTSQEVHSIVSSNIETHNTPTTKEEVETAEKTKNSYNILLKNVRFIKLAIINYELKKESGSLDAGAKKKYTNVLTMVLSFIFTTILSASGFIVLSDVANKLLGRPNALDNSLKDNKPTQKPIQIITSTQTRFPANPSYDKKTYSESDTWTENFSNSKSGIESMLVNFAKEVYLGLDNLDNIIKSNPSFQVVVENILWYNKNAQGDPFIFIPPHFTSKKEIVDLFIDSVAKRAPN